MKKILLFIAFVICFPVYAVSHFEVRVFNVGAANFVLLSNIQGQQKRHLIVDAGYDKASNQFQVICPSSNKQEIIKTAISLIGNDPFNVIISHLDKDHYNLMFNLSATKQKKEDNDDFLFILGAKKRKANMVIVGAEKDVSLKQSIASLSSSIFRVQNKINGTVLNEKAQQPYLLKSIEDSLLKDFGSKVRILLPANYDRKKYDIPNSVPPYNVCSFAKGKKLPEEEEDNDRNENSLVVYIEFFGRSILICGDANANLLAAIKGAHTELQKPIDILIPPHHLSISNGEAAIFTMFEPKLCICSTRPHSQYHFPRSYIGNIPFHWAFPSFVAPHSLSFLGVPNFDSGNVVCKMIEHTSPQLQFSCSSFLNVLAPIFSTFDSEALFYRLIIENFDRDTGIIRLFANREELFRSLSIENESLVYKRIMKGKQGSLATPDEQIGSIGKYNPDGSLTLLLTLAHILDDMCDYANYELEKYSQQCESILLKMLGNPELRAKLSLFSTASTSTIPLEPQFRTSIFMKFARFFLNQNNRYRTFGDILKNNYASEVSTIPIPRLAVGRTLENLQKQYKLFGNYCSPQGVSSSIPSSSKIQMRFPDSNNSSSGLFCSYSTPSNSMIQNNLTFPQLSYGPSNAQFPSNMIKVDKQIVPSISYINTVFSQTHVSPNCTAEMRTPSMSKISLDTSYHNNYHLTLKNSPPPLPSTPALKLLSPEKQVFPLRATGMEIEKSPTLTATPIHHLLSSSNITPSSLYPRTISNIHSSTSFLVQNNVISSLSTPSSYNPYMSNIPFSMQNNIFSLGFPSKNFSTTTSFSSHAHHPSLSEETYHKNSRQIFALNSMVSPSPPDES
ncbi:MAG: hypothetical protein LBU02_00560 [Rickettsiales bacterium]|nr:hypothetical protein [Rickettsiales bacterium]